MEFSELFDGKHAVFSPNGRFLACVCGDYVDLRYSDTLLKAFKFECLDLVKVRGTAECLQMLFTLISSFLFLSLSLN